MECEEQNNEQMFNRIQEINELDKQWIENELKRTQSAPEMAESGVDSLRLSTDEPNLR
jgi:molybdenum cofactor biosynthesis enzyme MoaA